MLWKIIKNYTNHGDRPLIYKSMNIECIPDPKYAVNSTCLIKAKNWNMAVLNMDCDLILPLRNTTIQMELFKKGYSNQYHPFLVNVAFNLCDIISKRNYLSYGTILWKIIKKYTNANHSCPLEGHLMARNLFIDSNNTFIPKLPLGFYLVSIKITENFLGQQIENVGLVKYYVQAAEMVQIKKKMN
ncbi:uncharacterized protein LOC117785851 [Drosophila innubila]|uniref:uncharacterized protein LOC117785851 n=1 Tax=Drosophila innubila TaxID=198719 RepID=UPI00148E12E6|nr:uncharacterized protein LOC117785851 [Drosophila innubila]